MTGRSAIFKGSHYSGAVSLTEQVAVSSQNSTADSATTTPNRYATDLSWSSVLVLLWCIAILAHFDDNLHFNHSQSKTYAHINLWATAFCFLGLFFARNRYLVMAILVLHISAVWNAMPVTDNHWWMSSFISCALLFGLLYQTARGRCRNAPLEDDSLNQVIPAIRWIVIFLYFFAVFHKLNSDFFDPNRTCAIHFYNRARANLPFWPFPDRPGEHLRYFLIGATLLLEGAPAIFLSIRRTWFLGIFFGAVFHLTTGLYMRHFPTIMLCIYFLFVPKDFSRQVLTTIDQSIRKLSRNSFGLVRVLQAQALFWTFWCFQINFHRRYFLRRGSDWSDYIYDYHTMLRVWFVVMLATAIVLLMIFFRYKGWRYFEKQWLFTRWWPLYALPMLFFFNGASPYLGLNGHPTMAMWSNLDVAGGHSNHLVIPAGALTVFPYTDDIVTILGTSPQDGAWRNQYVKGNSRIPFSMLKRKILHLKSKGRTDIYLRYERAGKQYDLRQAEMDPEFAQPEPYWFKKLIHIKDPPKGNRGVCRS